MSRSRLFCDGWEFSKNPIGTEYEDAKDWHPVDIPHDWLIYNTADLYETSTGWYRRRLTLDALPVTRTAIRFEGVYMDSSVYVNGRKAGEWKYGYSTFEFDITELLCKGENLIALRADYRSPNSRWYSGAGIYRRVWLKSYPHCHLSSDGIYISGNVSKDLSSAKVSVTCETERPSDTASDDMSVCAVIFDGDREIDRITRPCCAFDAGCIPPAVRKEDCAYTVNTFTFDMQKPALWDIDDPHLYSCTVLLMKNGQIIDSDQSTFGLRRAEFTADKGFFLNNRHLKLHGCCEHHDLGALGAAVNRDAIKRKLTKLKKMGINAIRTSHNMPAVELMELADEMGLLIVSEGFDMWERHKTDYDYAGFFTEWVCRDVASWIRRDRNHPSVIAWSIGNEIYDVHADSRGQEITSLLMNQVRLYDPKGNGVVTQGSNYMQWENAQKCTDILKIAGYNYAERLYDEHHKKYPDWVIYGSETASTLQSRGIYHFPYSQSVLADDDEQCSSLGNCCTGWGARCSEACIIPDRDAEYCAGQFIWTGFDYIGEPTPYSTKNSYFGQFDTAGFPKDSAYIYRAEWTDCKKSPFVHIFPYWDNHEDQDTDVRVTTNAPAVKLLLNGTEIASKQIDHAHGKELTLNAVIPYQKGVLTAIAYDSKGNEIARDEQRSFGDTAQIRLTPENGSTLRANGTDLIFLDIEAFDSNGVHVANANNRVTVNVSGAGRLIGLDNGDSTDYDQYKGTSRRLFSGKLLAIIAASDKAGDINVTVTSNGLPDSAITLTALPDSLPEGVSYSESNAPMASECPDSGNDIPVRKIAFESDSVVFTSDKKEITFKTIVYPNNASYKEQIEYRVTTVLGIPVNTAEIVSSDSGSVTVRCKGDGEFYLRALCKNGTEKYHILSALRLSGEGLGAAAFDPYEFVTAGLFTVSSGNTENAIERGTSFAREDCWFGFENVDFGSIGSDTVTVPIYANCTTPVKLRVYDGIPDKGGELIGDFTYHKSPVWLTYIPETFKLSKKLIGVHTLVMASSDGYSVKGFEFERPVRERAEISAASCERIYGDRFTRNESDVTGIGNNVVLSFGDFDFTEHKASKVIITGRSVLPVNSIHLIFKEGDSQTRCLLEFERADEYTERCFEIDTLSGKGEISFAFLPGSDFDFQSFKFI